MAKAVAYTYDEIHNGRLDFVRDGVQNAKGGPPVTYEEWVSRKRRSYLNCCSTLWRGQCSAMPEHCLRGDINMADRK
jgi:hypothetical protein